MDATADRGFRWVQKDQLWRLHWSDRNARWRPYELCGPIRDVLRLLDEDPGHWCWG